MDTQHPPHGMKAGHKALSRLNLRKQRSNDAHQQLENLAKRDAKDSIRTIFPTTLALARNDATRALQAIQEGDPSWQRLAESIVESGEDPVAREAMCRLLGRE
jgi:hypothetical protein